MAPPNTRARANWAVERATALPEVWALVAKHRGVLGARRLMRVCRASRAGATEYLRTLPGLVVCGGFGQGVIVSGAWRLDLATLQWEPMPALVTGRYNHACCAVRGTLVVLGGSTMAGPNGRSVEMLSSSVQGAFVDLPALSCGRIRGAAAVAVEESDSAAGQVLLLGGADEDFTLLSTVHLVDLATGACAPPQPNLIHARMFPAAGRLPEGASSVRGGSVMSWHSMMALRTGWLCRPCTTRGSTSHAGLSPGASSSPVGSVVHRLKCTMRSSTGGCGFRAICLTNRLSLLWAARFCRTIPGTRSYK
jgi:hypothetical protein